MVPYLDVRTWRRSAGAQLRSDSGPRSNNCSNSAFTCATCPSCTSALAQKVVLQLQHERDIGNLSPDGQATGPSVSRDGERPSGTHHGHKELTGHAAALANADEAQDCEQDHRS
jgi:hypothetical protein